MQYLFHLLILFYLLILRYMNILYNALRFLLLSLLILALSPIFALLHGKLSPKGPFVVLWNVVHLIKSGTISGYLLFSVVISGGSLVWIGLIYGKRRLKAMISRQVIKKVRASTPSSLKIKSFIFLRPFADDGNIGGRVRGFSEDHPDDIVRARGRWNLERQIADTLDSYGIFWAIGQGRAFGAARIASTEADWQHEVVQLMQRAELIICVPRANEGTKWEINKLFELKLENKAVFMDPGCNFLPPDRASFFPHGKEVDLKIAWSKLKRELPEFNFPEFDPVGEFFMIERQTDSCEVSRYKISARQSWGKSVRLDLLALLDRCELIRLSIWDRWRVDRYMDDRLPYFGVESQWYREASVYERMTVERG
jgi:hypothetical protein